MDSALSRSKKSGLDFFDKLDKVILTLSTAYFPAAIL